MKGPAGVGKSAIAQTCVERLQKKGVLGASFFFSISGQRKPETFFPTIAYQLSTFHQPYFDLIDQRIRRDKTLINKALQFQFQYLIDEPLRELQESGKGIQGKVQIFVDGLDECEGTDAQCEIIRIVAGAASEGVIPLQWAFFSRPEPHIEATFSMASVAPLCYKTILPISRDADGEIRLYLRNAFSNILQRHNPSAQTEWPSVVEMDTVIDGTSGSFIYATTVVRFVGHQDSVSPQKRLRVVIDIITDRRSHPDGSADAPFAELYAFYLLILQRIPAKLLPSVHLLLAYLCGPWGGPSAIFIANLLGMSKDEIETVCHHLSAVIHFEDPGKQLELDPTIDTSRVYTQALRKLPREFGPQVFNYLGGQIRFYHKSFSDFLRDAAHSGSYCVRASGALANQHLKLLLDYDRSVCWRDSGMFTPPHLLCACF